jgi:bacteriorhodopsin
MSYNSDTKVTAPPTIPTTIPMIPRQPGNESAAVSTITPTKTSEKIENKINPVQYYVKGSFMVTYILLLTTATITFIEAMRTNIPEVRHVLNLETCISIVAGYFYSVFLTQIEGFGKDNKPVDWMDITKTRYIDWSITTPLMLLTLCIVLGHQIGKKVDLYNIVTIILLNYIMLYIGFLGEDKQLNKIVATIAGFVPFILMFYIVYKNYVQPKYNLSGSVLFGIYVSVWGLYGAAYLLPEQYKNISMNILDCVAKCFIGLGLWAYYSRIIVV